MSDLTVELVQLSDMQLDSKNARKHSERNLDAIKESLRQFGQRKPIVITHEGTVVAGNGTVEAARDLGWVQLTATRIPKDWSEQQITAYAIADNRTAELASWDSDILIPTLEELDEAGMLDWTGFTKDELENWHHLLPDDEPSEPEAEVKENSEGQGDLLAIANVSIDEPAHTVERHDMWMLTMPNSDVTHVLIVAEVMKEWHMWKDYLQEEAVFVPYPDPYVTHTEIAHERPFVLVQPDHYLAGHVLDKHASAYGETHVQRVP